ncbi:class I SAM-dependent methyltransferase [Pseudomonadota bacterium]
MSPFKKRIKQFAKKLPIIKDLIAERDRLRTENAAIRSESDAIRCESDAIRSECDAIRHELEDLKRLQGFVPPGHFYSPIPDINELQNIDGEFIGCTSKKIPGVELNDDEQLELLKRFSGFYREMPFQAEKQEGLRYYFENPAYSYSDAILLHCMIRHLKPNRIIEVGSGFSSCMILDTNDLFFDGSLATTFIEPYPELLMSLIGDPDQDRIEIIPSRLQDVDLSKFDELEENDILFIDSTHVSKINSDVNRIFFDVLPRLSTGVHVHFHDIFFPFEYPREWLLEGRAWNEAYMLKAFLQFNHAFHPVLMNTYMTNFHESFFEENMPLCLKNTGASIWLKRI